jgi:hypothetical protein
MDTADASTRWMTYAELAEARGIGRRSAMRLALRHRWPRRRGNDGLARVGVPAGAERQAERQAPASDAPALALLREALDTLRAQLDRAEAGTEHERAASQRALERAEAAEATLARLRAGGRWRRLRRAWRGG